MLAPSVEVLHVVLLLMLLILVVVLAEVDWIVTAHCEDWPLLIMTVTDAPLSLFSSSTSKGSLVFSVVSVRASALALLKPKAESEVWLLRIHFIVSLYSVLTVAVSK